jgi:Tfp pilus assembly protein PilV
MRLTRFKLAKAERGDTIVEVLIAMAVLALIITGADVAVNRTAKSALDVQEHAQALKLVESQAEALRNYNGSASFDCFSYNPITKTLTPATAITPLPSPCTFDGDGSEATTTSVPAYTVTITPGSVTPITYTIAATWPNVFGPGVASVSLEYRNQ